MNQLTLAVLYPGCISFEIMLAMELLNDTFPVQVATPEGKMHHATNGLHITAQHSFATAPASEAQVILVPGGDPGKVVENPTHSQALSQLLQTALEHKAWIGAICAGPLLLAQAHLLKGKRFTHGYQDLHPEFLAPFWEGAHFEDAPLVVDGQIITAQPQAHIDFATEIARLSGVFKEVERAQSLNAYYKGQIVPA